MPLVRPITIERAAAITIFTAGPANADDYFFTRFIRHPLKPRQTADGQQSDVARFDAVAPSGKCVAEFVHDHAKENQENEKEAIDGRSHSAFAVIDIPDPGEKKEKRAVNPDIDSRDTANAEWTSASL